MFQMTWDMFWPHSTSHLLYYSLTFLPFSSLMFLCIIIFSSHVLVYSHFTYHRSLCWQLLFCSFWSFFISHKSLLCFMWCLVLHACIYYHFSFFSKLSIIWYFYVIFSHPIQFHRILKSFIVVSNCRDVGPKIWPPWKLAIWFIFLMCHMNSIFRSIFSWSLFNVNIDIMSIFQSIARRLISFRKLISGLLGMTPF